MKIKTLIKKIILTAIILPSLAISSFSILGTTTTHATQNPVGQTCSTITLTSNVQTTMTAGFTTTNPISAPGSLSTSLYSDNSLVGAVAANTVIPPWIDPSVDSNFTGTNAIWVSGATWPGGVDNSDGTANADQWRLFHDSFVLPADATVTSANIWYSADNAAAVYLNGNGSPISTTNGVTDEIYGTTTNTTQNYNQVFTSSFTPVSGNNTLDFILRNWSTVGSTNPTGLIYKAIIIYCTPIIPGNVTVTITKYINGRMATGSMANNIDFPMSATWNASNIGAGTGVYTLSKNGFGGDPTPYQAITAQMAIGSDYSTNEILTNNTVGATCQSDNSFALRGYTTGDTYAQAASGTPTTTSPAFTNLQNNKYVIVWNRDCSPSQGTISGNVKSLNGILRVTSIESVDTSAIANGTFADGWKYIFHITAPMNEQNLAMKFSDWFKSGNGTIPVANNMRISSAQADNRGATILLTGADTYSNPLAHMTGDLDSVMPGRQVEVTVEVAIPVNTPNGAYTTNYGVQTNP